MEVCSWFVFTVLFINVERGSPASTCKTFLELETEVDFDVIEFCLSSRENLMQDERH
jgi:hypothetical protein